MRNFLMILVAIAMIATIWLYVVPGKQFADAPNTPVTIQDEPEQQAVLVGTPPETSLPYAELLRLGDELAEISRTREKLAVQSAFAPAESTKGWSQAFGSFSALAKAEAAAIDQKDGPHDLACIFRGMAADATQKLEQLEAANTRGEQAPVWRDAGFLFEDLRAVLVPTDGTPQKGNQYEGKTCPVDDGFD